ncbi:MAG: hypothetical protein MJE68_33660 [Proteobacteria bacterium]|nr:hypothetical protein [Pseudomonadota bacterium]
MLDFYTETGINKPTVTVLERDGDHTILITLQDKPWQLMQALEVFQVSIIVSHVVCIVKLKSNIND